MQHLNVKRTVPLSKVWDDEIALMAQTHAQQCEFKHDVCRSVGKWRIKYI